MSWAPIIVPLESNFYMSPTNRLVQIVDCLVARYPNTDPFLTHANPFELLIAVILSAQCTDERVNQVTPALFKAFPTPFVMGNTSPDVLEPYIQSITYYKTKAKHCIATAHTIAMEHGGRVPAKLDALVALPGVGRKTANVVLGQAYGQPGITVDTHVNRVSRRLGMTKGTTPERIEKDLQRAWPRAWWTDLSTRLIQHGRTYCHARKPNCTECPLDLYCPSTPAQLKGRRVKAPSK